MVRSPSVRHRVRLTPGIGRRRERAPGLDQDHLRATEGGGPPVDHLRFMPSAGEICKD